MFSKDKSNKRRKRNVAPTIISEDLTITGNLDCEGEIQIDGTVEGDIHAGQLCIGETGRVIGAIVTDTAMVRGHIKGQIRSREVTLTRTAQINGDIYHETLSIEPGAQVEGNCRRLNVVEDSGINLVVSDGLPAGPRN
jgi:cytoskeletal protein CcmA (bactofilin family)